MITIIRPVAGVLVGVGSAHAALRARPADPADERRAADLPEWRAAEYLAARNILRELLARVDGHAADEPIAARDGGQPHLPARPDLGVSLSHSHGLVAAAVGVVHAVGVDVEAVSGRASDALLKRCCTQAARTYLSSLDAARRATEFTWVWTVQEACVKAAGLGLGGRPWEIPVEPGEASGRWHGYGWQALRTRSAIPLSCAYGPVLGLEDAA